MIKKILQDIEEHSKKYIWILKMLLAGDNYTAEKVIERLQVMICNNPQQKLTEMAIKMENQLDNLHQLCNEFPLEIQNDIVLFNDVQGYPASQGKVQGIVRLVKDRSELHKVQKGDILVTKLTTPDFVVAMEKAAAIVTDLGGITSHAAIVSRELGVPCIVGTEVATQVFKDGEEQVRLFKEVIQREELDQNVADKVIANYRALNRGEEWTTGSQKRAII